MAHLPEFSSARELYYGRDPYLDAWVLHFMTENNLEHTVDPKQNASPEQIRFMVVLDPDQVFAPCSDWMLKNLLNREMTEELMTEYKRQWRFHARLLKDYIPDPYTRKRIVALSRHKFSKVLSTPFLIPSRLNKHLTTIFLTQSGVEDPYRERKVEANRRVGEFIEQKSLDRLLNACPDSSMGCSKIRDLRWELDLMELRRLFCLSTHQPIWEEESYQPQWKSLEEYVNAHLPELDRTLTELLGPDASGQKRIMYLPDRSGGVIFDILIVRALLRLGHRVVMALKEGFYFDAPTFWDHEHDPVLSRALEGAYFLDDNAVSKNRLLRIQRENPLLVISDGTRERLNFYRTSVTFARAWKESDLVITKGEGNYRRLIMTSHEFTRDVLCLFRDTHKTLRFFFKPRSKRTFHFSEHQLLEKSDHIIRDMRRAREQGYKVMFYSAIISSIPGQTPEAIKLLNRFVEYLRARLEKTYIINPAEHFAEGLDGDDLMFMWERVQRSGLIDVWRFQSVADIEKSYELLGEKVPPIWNGKDATFSTGCTKEMQIALEMQKLHRELQILGPSPEKFFRRREYGVGKFFDATIGDPVDRVRRF
ncbi:MAG: ARMT1-like domain-containing protein [Desulfovibrionales bacterium]